MSVFGVFLVRIFPHSDWMRKLTEETSVFRLNAGNCGSEKLRYNMKSLQLYQKRDSDNSVCLYIFRTFWEHLLQKTFWRLLLKTAVMKIIISDLHHHHRYHLDFSKSNLNFMIITTSLKQSIAWFHSMSTQSQKYLNILLFILVHSLQQKWH